MILTDSVARLGSLPRPSRPRPRQKAIWGVHPLRYPRYWILERGRVSNSLQRFREHPSIQLGRQAQQAFWRKIRDWRCLAAKDLLGRRCSHWYVHLAILAIHLMLKLTLRRRQPTECRSFGREAQGDLARLSGERGLVRIRKKEEVQMRLQRCMLELNMLSHAALACLCIDH